MELHLSHERIDHVRSVLNTSVIQEETMEMIVPDALPDILRIICADATVLVRSKDTDAGRVSVSGIAAATVIYAPDGAGGVRRIGIDIPFTISAAESEITPASKVTARVSAVNADASMINPRKFAVRVSLCAELACYNDAELSVCSDVEPNEEAGIEILKESLAVRIPVDVREKPFVISDELAIPNSSPQIGEILRSRAAVTAEEARVVGNKVIFRGNAVISLLYSPADGGELCGAELASEFSQIMEFANISEECEFELVLMLTGSYIEAGGMEVSDGRQIRAELHVVAQCVAIEKKVIPFVGDVYSTRFNLTQNASELAFENKDSAISVSSVFRGTLETEDDVSRVISVSAVAGAVESAAENGVMTMKAPLFVKCIYTDGGGRIQSASGRFEVEATGDARGGCKYTINASCGREVYGVSSGNGIELRLPVDFIIMGTAPVRVSPVSEISYDEDTALDTSKIPSIMISKTVNGDTLWKLAKRHRSTTELILSANGLENEEDVAAGQMLIVPKKR